MYSTASNCQQCNCQGLQHGSPTWPEALVTSKIKNISPGMKWIFNCLVICITITKLASSFRSIFHLCFYRVLSNQLSTTTVLNITVMDTISANIRFGGWATTWKPDIEQIFPIYYLISCYPTWKSPSNTNTISGV